MTVTFRTTNIGAERAPFGLGFHPYLTIGTGSIDRLELTLPATSYLDDGRPAPEPVAATPRDFTQPSAGRVDPPGHRLRGPGAGPDGRALARLEDPDDGRFVELWVDGGFRYLMVYTADQVGRPVAAGTAVAIEPMTCPPDAFRTGTDLVELDPGESWQGSWGLRAGSGV